LQSQPMTGSNECFICRVSNAWSHKDCPECPSYQKNHYTLSKGGEIGNTDFFCVAESPHLSSLVHKENHSGWVFQIERSIFTFFTLAGNKYDTPIGRFTYAVKCQEEKPSAAEIKACAPNLVDEILLYSNPNKPICVFVMGATGLKSLGIQFGKYTDVISKTIETTIGGRPAYVFVSMSKRQLSTKAGFSQVLERQIEVFLDMVKKNKEGKLEERRTALSRLSKDYKYPKNIQELAELTDEILNYSVIDESKESSPLAIDTETNTLYPHRQKLKVLIVSLCWDVGKAASIQLEHPESNIKLKDAQPYLERIFSCNKPKIFANAKFDIKVLRRRGFEVNRLAWDAMLGEHLVEEDKKGFYGLKSLARLRLPEFASYEDELKAIYAGRVDTEDLTITDSIYETAETQLLKKPKIAKKKKKKKEEGDEEEYKPSRLEKKLAADDGYATIPLRELLVYAAFDADVTFRSAMQQRKELTDECNALHNKRRAYQQANTAKAHKIGEALCRIPNPPLYNMAKRILPTTQVLAKMEMTGIKVDREYIIKLKTEMDSYIASSESLFADMIPVGLENFNPASTQHVAKVLFSTGYINPEDQQVICYAGKIEPEKTDKGAISTGAKFLKLLALTHKCKFSEAVLEFRAISKARTTFVENIEVLSREDGRLHSNFHQHSTATARLCVSKDTILNTSLGPIRIENLDLVQDPGIKIQTHTGNWRRITALYYKGKEEMYRVVLENGNSIITTKQHRFLTPQGFQHLSTLYQKAEVNTYEYCVNPKQHRYGYKRRGFRSAILNRKIKFSRIPKTRDFTTYYLPLNKSLQSQVLSRDKRTETLQLFSSLKRKYSWEKRTSRNTYSIRETTAFPRSRLQLENDCQRTRCQRVVCSTKHETLWCRKNRKITLPSNERRPRYVKNSGAIYSRSSECGYTLLRRSSKLLSKDVRSIICLNRNTLVRKRTNTRIPQLSNTEYHKEKPYLLELKSARNVGIHGTVNGKYSTHTPKNVTQKLYGRFWISWKSPFSRNRRQLSWERRYPKTRQIKVRSGQTPRLPSSSLFHRHGRERTSENNRRNSYNTIATTTIASITSVGVMDVWDIEVEQDHSYFAQGFINHNSSTEENMQNLPTKMGRPPFQYNIKRIFIPSHEDYVFVNADAKAAEVRIYAAYSKDKALIAALNDGMDPHSFFASTVYNAANVLQGIPKPLHRNVLTTIGIDEHHAWNYEDFEARDTLKKTDKAYGSQLDALRKNIKRVVFGILYGAAPKKISGIVGIPEEQADAIIRTLFNMFPSIKDYINITKEQVRRMGIVETFLGRRRHLNLGNLPDYLKSRAERQAVNFKIQNTSAELVLEVLCATFSVIHHDFNGNVLNTVHDSLVFEIPKKYVHQMPDFINDYGMKQIAKKYPWLPVPFTWDVSVGPTYGDLMSVESYLSNNPEIQSDEDDYIDLEIRNELYDEATLGMHRQAS